VNSGSRRALARHRLSKALAELELDGCRASVHSDSDGAPWLLIETRDGGELRQGSTAGVEAFIGGRRVLAGLTVGLDPADIVAEPTEVLVAKGAAAWIAIAPLNTDIRLTFVDSSGAAVLIQEWPADPQLRSARPSLLRRLIPFGRPPRRLYFSP
jgi:hypothetical protein